MKHHRIPKVTLALAGGLLVAAIVWWTVAVPALVKYPTDLDVTPQYTGTFTVLVDPATGAPLAKPVVLPLTVQRHLQALGDESGADTVVVKETISQKAGTLLDATQTNVYVMDRSTLKNLRDPRAYAFEPENVVDRSGAYRLNLPFDTSRDQTYPIYKNEIGTTYTMRANGANPTGHIEGLDVSNFRASVRAAPITAAYLAELEKAAGGLPRERTLEQLKPQLLQAGVDIDATVAALAPVISTADLATLGQIAAKPIPLGYVSTFDGRAAVEPTTGAEVKVGATESIGVLPQLSDLPVLLTVLGHYPNVPEAKTAAAGLTKLAASPVKLFEYRYDQTPASVADIADEVKGNRRQVLIAKEYIPFGLLVLAGVALIVAAVRWWRSGAVDVEIPTPTPAAPEPELVGGPR